MSASELLVPQALRVFLAIAEHGGVTAAARALHLSQPAVTATLQRLEEALGTTLVVRTSRGVTLTSTGQALARHARGAERASLDALREIASLEGEPRGAFSLGCHESLGAYFLPPMLAEFFPRHPAIELALVNANSRDVEQMVIDRRVDFGVVVNASRHDDTVVVPLFSDRVVLVAHRRIAREGRASIAAHPLVFVPALRQTQYVLGALDQAGIAPARQVSCVSLELVKSLVLDGAGVGILPLRVARHHTAEGVVVELPGALPSFDDHVSLVRRADLHETAAARLVLDALRARGKALAESEGERPPAWRAKARSRAEKRAR